MDPYQKLLLAACIALAIRLILAIVAMKRGRWGWRPWGVIALEFSLELLLPAHEAVFSVAALITLITMCIIKRKPKQLEQDQEG